MADSPDKPTRRKDERPTEIVRAALDVFTEVGFANARIIDIAKRAGAAKGTVYLYFETKDDLFRAVVHDHVRPVFNQMSAMVDQFPGSTRELLTNVLRKAYGELADSAERRAILRILIAEGDRFPALTELYHREVISGAQKMMSKIVQRGIDSGEFAPTQAVKFPQVIVGPLMMSSLWKMLFEKFHPLDLDAVFEAHIDLLFNGLGPKRP